MFLPVSDWAPDRAPAGGAHLAVARNVFPLPDGADGPVRAPVPLSDPLPGGPPRGAVAVRLDDGGAAVFAGTATNLYRLDDRAWVAVGKPGGHALDGDHVWRFALFGSRVVAVAPSEAPQSLTLGGGGGFADLAAGAPKAAFVATLEPGFLVLGDYNAPGYAARAGLWWSGLNDASLWPAPGTAAAQSVQSDLQQLSGGGALAGIVPAVNGGGLVFTDRAIYRMTYIGPPAAWDIDQVDAVRGCAAPDSIAPVGGAAFFLAEDGFQLFDGGACQPIGHNAVDAHFRASVDPDGLARVRATVDLARKLVVWGYPTAGAGIDRWLSYNWATRRWRECDDPAVVTGWLFPARAPGVSLDGLDALYPAGVDSIPFGLDSPILRGGRAVLAGFNASHQLVAYEGAPLGARVETADIDPAPGGRRLFVGGFRVETDAAAPRAGAGVRESLAAAPAFAPLTAPAADGFCPQRATGRHVRAAVEIPAGQDWTFLRGAELRAAPAGRR